MLQGFFCYLVDISPHLGFLFYSAFVLFGSSPVQGNIRAWLTVCNVHEPPVISHVLPIFYVQILKDVKFPLELDLFTFCSEALQKQLFPMREKFRMEEDLVVHGLTKKGESKKIESHIWMLRHGFAHQIHISLDAQSFFG